MKLVAIFAFSLIGPLGAQTAAPQSSQHGITADTQSTYVFEPADATSVSNVCMNQRELGFLAALSRTAPGAGFNLPPATATPCAEFEAWVEQLPADYQESVGGGISATERGPSKTTLQRFVRDNFRHVYMQYAVTVEALPETGSYRVAFGDSKAEAPADLRPKDEWKVVSPNRYPVPQIVQDGDEIPMELYTNSKGIKLVDYIHIGRQDKLAKRKDSARDSYAEDAEFTFTQPKVRVNGLKMDSAILPETLRGGVLWIYAPGHGRYVVAFSPYSGLGLEKAGEVAGSLMTLVVEGDILRIDNSDRIAMGGGVYNVYGWRDPKWEPADPKDRDHVMIGTAPGIEPAIGLH